MKFTERERKWWRIVLCVIFFLWIIAQSLFNLIVWWRLDRMAFVNQVNTNTQQIQGVINFLNKQTQPGVPPQIEKKEEKK